MKSLFNPVYWLLAAVGVLFIALSLTTVYAADATSLSKMQNEMLSLTGQLNENCSATLIHSKRDDKSGEVSTIFLTAKHCVVGNKTDMVIDLPVYQGNRIVKKDRYIARVRGEYFDGDLALVELRDKQTFFAKVAKISGDKPALFMGEDVWTVGYPLAMSLTITKGLFGAIETSNYDKPGAEYFRATPDIAGGNSGGAMYHMDAKGDYALLGVTAARARSDSFIGLYTPIEVIHKYLSVALPEAVAAGK